MSTPLLFSVSLAAVAAAAAVSVAADIVRVLAALLLL
jgi:hypothetical protein